MITNTKFLTLGLSALVCGMAAFGYAQDPTSVQRVDLRLKDAELLSALQALSLQTGIEYSIQTSNTELRRITVNLMGKSADEAIRYLVTAAGATVERDEAGVYIIRTTPKADGTAVANPLNAIQKPMILRTIRVKHADPEYLYNLIRHGNNRDVFEDFQRLRRFASNISQQTGYAAGSNGDWTKPVPTASFPQAMSNDLANGVALPGEAANQRFGGGGGGGAQGGGGGGFQPGGGGGGFGGGGQGGGQGGGGQAGAGLGLQADQGFVPAGLDRFSYDPVTNSIIVRGSEDAIRELERIIEQFDVRPKQVHVDVKFITTSNSVDKSLGLDWLYQRGGVFAGNRPGSFARANDPVFINYAFGNITTRLRTLLSEGWGRVVNNPSLTTPNNQPAAFQSQTTTTIFVNTITNGPGGVVIIPQPQPVTITNGLIVRPRINGDGTVTMGLNPQIGDFGQIRRGPDGSEVPDFLTQSLAVVVTVKSGQTIALGGLTRKLDNYSRSRIPLLSDLPIVGQLFQGRNSQQTTQDLTVFVTPTILDDEDLGLGP